jgi:hypothetical protein
VFDGSLEHGVRVSILCCCIWQESGFGRCEDVFTRNLFPKDIRKFCTFSTISKINAAMMVLLFNTRKVPVNFSRPYYSSNSSIISQSIFEGKVVADTYEAPRHEDVRVD